MEMGSIKNAVKSLFTSDRPVNLSRRGFMVGSASAVAGALVLGVGFPVGAGRARAAEVVPGTRVPAFLEIRPDSSVRLMSPFNEGGQGIFTAMAQIVGEELDADPATFEVVNAPAGADYKVMNVPFGRITGGSMSVRTSYDTMRRLGALARQMLINAASARLDVPAQDLTTEPGRVIHAASGRSLTYGELAQEAMDLPVPATDSVTLRTPDSFRWIGKGLKRLDVHAKSTGQAAYSIDQTVEGMLQAAIQHAPRLGLTVGKITNQAQVAAMPGVHSVHILDGAVAVVAERWWKARKAVEAAQVDWVDPGAKGTDKRYVPADFSTAGFADFLAAQTGDGKADEEDGDALGTLAKAAPERIVEATYSSQYLHHAQLEPPSATARFNDDGTLDVWLPNQAPEMFQGLIAQVAGIDVAKVNVHSPMLGGFFGRHFLYPHGNPYPQAIVLAKKVGRPVKVIWSREEEFLRDPLRPMAVVRMKAAVGADGMPTALSVVSACEGPTEAVFGHSEDKIDPTALEGLSGKAYAIPNKRIAQIYVPNSMSLAYWRSVGNSMNDFFYESFLDEIAAKGGIDSVELRRRLLKDNARLSTLLEAVVETSGGWNAGPYKAADGTTRARGVAMASPFGSHTAAIAEVSLDKGSVVVHEVWQAIDPGSIVNPAIIDAQINSAVALGLSQVLFEETVYENGQPAARNYDLYKILPPSAMPRVHTRIVESGAPMGGIGEPGLPAIPPAVVNAVSRLTGQRVRSMPLANITFAG
jgi:isoquinoline 1-oxidoreductase beta subunit